jgi:peptide/nickel transport system substrate-binding protein
MSRRISGIFLTMLLTVCPAVAQELRLGMSAAPTSIDPLLFAFVPNNQIKAHIFDTLIYVDANGHLMPSLAESWAPADATTWEFRLRPGVTFHDGTALTIEDVAFSIDRADKVPNSPASSFAMFTKGIAERSRGR